MRLAAAVSICALATSLVAVGARADDAPRRPLVVPPLFDGQDVGFAGEERDGTRRIIAYGVRVLLRPDGEVSVATELLPYGKAIQSIELPERLGSGFLFAASALGRTALWRAESFHGPLTPVGELDFESERIVAGFDRIYVQARRTGEWAALDVQTGRARDRGTLPPSPSYGAMAFADPWFGAVEVPVRGLLATFDAGASWHELGLVGTNVTAAEGRLLVSTAERTYGVEPDGRVHPLPSGSEVADGRAAPSARVRRGGPLGPLPLDVAVLRGYPDSETTAVVAARGALARVRLTDGRVLALRERVLPPTAECSGIPLGRGFGFVCAEPGGRTEIYAFERPLALRRVHAFEEPRFVSASGNGGLVVRGPCGQRAPAAPARYCIRTPQGRWFEVPMPSGAGTERVVALADGRAAVLFPPGRGRPGKLALVDEIGTVSTVPLTISARDEALRALVSEGFWMDGFVQNDAGLLSGWAVGRGAFTGIRIALDGAVTSGPLQHGIEDALISGERALVLGPSGIAEQSSDGGFSWSDADLPATVELDRGRGERITTPGEQGCSAVGCAFLGWLRIGWNGAESPRPLAMAKRPNPTALPQPGGGRWTLSCTPTGVASRPALPLVARRGAPTGVTAHAHAPWLPLLEVPAPTIGRDSVGLDTGTEAELVQLRAYLWAPRHAPLGRQGTFLVRAADRFQVQSGVWSTTPSASPWPDLDQAAEAFGYEGAGASSWRLALDPSGRGGVLAVSYRGTTDLYIVEENRPIRAIGNAPRQGIGSLTSAVRLGPVWHVATQQDARTFRIFALEANGPRLVGEYRDVPFGRVGAPVLVRSTRGESLGIWMRSAHWYVFPIDPRTGASDAGIEIPARALARLPRVCGEDEEGFLLEGRLGLEPYVDFPGNEGEISARAVEGRFIATPYGVCVQSLAAQADRAIRTTPARSTSASARAETVPLVLTDRAEGGRRFEFRCQ